MSKVHEALKRAQEERASAGSPIRVNGIGQNNDGPRVSIAAVNHLHVETPLLATDAVTHQVAAATIVPPYVHADTAADSAIPKSPPRPFSAEHRVHTPATGRDPRTGQFLRFEDLLKSCAKPTWVLDPTKVAFCGA